MKELQDKSFLCGVNDPGGGKPVQTLRSEYG
jgi:hypothetical protein